MRSSTGLRWKEPCKGMCRACTVCCKGPERANRRQQKTAVHQQSFAGKHAWSLRMGRDRHPLPATLNTRKPSVPAPLCCLPNVLVYVSTSIASQMRENQDCTEHPLLQGTNIHWHANWRLVFCSVLVRFFFFQVPVASASTITIKEPVWTKYKQLRSRNPTFRHALSHIRRWLYLLCAWPWQLLQIRRPKDGFNVSSEPQVRWPLKIKKI